MCTLLPIGRLGVRFKVHTIEYLYDYINLIVYLFLVEGGGAIGDLVTPRCL